jgi:hypothetical protein
VHSALSRLAPDSDPTRRYIVRALDTGERRVIGIKQCYLAVMTLPLIVSACAAASAGARQRVHLKFAHEHR